ncbi:MAG: ABC transporter permease [Deltaproteobacteria bacterium RBG_13_51_10]|jgi:branched-chain amino acid transport system permease protein|nr:MAG: ABC transporter permease [Deltaproteobacteria bacterium RBG_13_51_10]
MELMKLFDCLGSISCLTTQIISALILGMVLFLVASGLSLIFGVLGVMNFAHGSLYMLGAYFTYTLLTLYGNFGVSVILASIGVGVFGVFFERVFIKRIYSSPLLYQLLLCYAFILILDDVVKLVWGYEFKNIGVPDAFRRPPIKIFQSFIPSYYFFIIVVGGVVAITLWLFLSKTRFGKVIRAAAHSSEMVGALGINVNLVYAGVFAIGSFLAGLGGVLAGPVRSIYPGMGASIIIESFIVVVVGGLGSIGGAFIGAILIGLMRSFGIIGFPLIEESFVFILMAIVLIVRPRGLFGKKEA